MMNLCRFLLITIPLLILLTWSSIDTTFMVNRIQEGVFFQPTMTPVGIMSLNDVKWTITSKLFGFMWQMLGSLTDIIALWFLYKIFKNYKDGFIFTKQNAQLYRKIGVFYFLDALILKPLSDTFLILALTWGNKPGERFLTLGFGTPSLRALFFAAVLIMISWVMIEASKIHDEQVLTV